MDLELRFDGGQDAHGWQDALVDLGRKTGHPLMELRFLIHGWRDALVLRFERGARRKTSNARSPSGLGPVIRLGLESIVHGWQDALVNLEFCFLRLGLEGVEDVVHGWQDALVDLELRFDGGQDALVDFGNDDIRFVDVVGPVVQGDRGRVQLEDVVSHVVLHDTVLDNTIRLADEAGHMRGGRCSSDSGLGEETAKRGGTANHGKTSQVARIVRKVGHMRGGRSSSDNGLDTETADRGIAANHRKNIQIAQVIRKMVLGGQRRVGAKLRRPGRTKGTSSTMAALQPTELGHRERGEILTEARMLSDIAANNVVGVQQLASGTRCRASDKSTELQGGQSRGDRLQPSSDVGEDRRRVKAVLLESETLPVRPGKADRGADGRSNSRRHNLARGTTGSSPAGNSLSNGSDIERRAGRCRVQCRRRCRRGKRRARRS